MKISLNCSLSELQKGRNSDDPQIQVHSQIVEKVNCSIEKLFLSSQTPQAIPLKIIQHIAKYSLNPFIETTTGLSEYPFGMLSNEKTSTSCIHTACMLASLLLGYKKAYQLHTHLRRCSYYELYEKLPSGKIWEFGATNLFDGLVLARLQKNNTNPLKITSETLSQLSTKYIEKDLNQFYTTIYSKIDKPKLYKESDEVIRSVSKALFEEVDFERNSDTIKLLEESILLNESKISPDKSCIYFISISNPTLDNKAKYEHVITQMDIEHEFLIEQFYNEMSNTSSYRLYHSMQSQATLSDELNQRSYGENGENSWNTKQLLKFLRSLSDLYTMNEKARTQKSYKECFGYSPEYEMDKQFLTFNNSLFSALSLRYIAQEINPRDVIQHLQEIIHCNPDLLQYFRM